MSQNNTILTTHQLDEYSLTQLFTNKICVLRIPQFCESSLCDKLTRWLEHNEKLTEYTYVMKRNNAVKSIYYGVDRVGVPYNSTYGDVKAKEKYYEEALPGIRTLRSVAYPSLSPIDRLRLELDENWSQGAQLANFEGKKMFIGIGRIMRPELSHLSEQQPHFDSVPTQYVDLHGQFSANIYLSVPKHGGELEIWDVAPIPTSVIHTNDPTKDWRSELPPSIIVKPEKGDLLLFNTRRPHAITQFKKKTRVAVQCFIGIHSHNPLAMWT